ncbi:MAG: ribbon-helix-helix domain-containing protein [Gaiellaceae bacterium]
MYSDAMARTQIHLGREEIELLDREAARTGASRSELIRRAVRRIYGPLSTGEKLEALEASFGAWKGRSFTGAEYVDAIRGDLNDRLRRLGLD